MKEHFKQINILWLSLLVGQLLFFVIVYFLITEKAEDSADIFQTLVPAVLLGALGGVYFLSKKRSQEGASLDGLQTKADHYRVTIIMRSALLEGANLLAVIGMLLDNPPTYLPYFAVGIAAFLYFRPSVNRFIQDYQLKSQEAEALRSDLA